MIVTKEIAEFAIEYLQTHDREKGKVDICVLDGYDCIEGPDGTIGFAVYSTEEHRIYVAGELPGDEEEVFATIAHEYKHFKQQMQGRRYSEVWAEVFAMKMRGRMLKAWQLGNRSGKNVQE